MSSGATAGESGRLDGLPLLSDAYPRAFFFRQSEGLAANPRVSFEEWEETFLPLDGIMGKCLDEEIPGRSSTNIEDFTRFKKRHPEKAVLLHFNGNARDPRYETGPYFAGHWLYRRGCGLTQDASAEPDESTLHVENPSLFRVNMGRYDDKNENLAICLLDEAGRPDWGRAEQLELLSVDTKAKTIRVRRGAFGTSSRAFPAGKSYIAPHVTEGPWGQRSHLLWAYNYATTCPKDAEGRTCSDRLLDDLCRWFGVDGPLSAFDGLEFDVLHFFPTGGGGRYGADVDADGFIDGGIVDGVNVFGLGVQRFLGRLRNRLGNDRLIMADGHGARHQRGVAYLNGIESEGWPTLSDVQIADWSGGLNRHWFWTSNAREPRLSYINHKFMDRGERVDVPINITRLVLAAALFTDSAFTYSFAPPAAEGKRLDVWDELHMGVANKPRWLGRPLGPTMRLGFDTPDLLEGAGREMSADFVARWTSDNATIEAEAGTLGVEKIDPAQDGMRLVMENVSLPPGDLLVRFTVRAGASRDYGESVPRLVSVHCNGAGVLITSERPEVAYALREGGEIPVEHAVRGAALVYRKGMSIGGETHDAYLTHPPYGPDQGPGYIVWEREATVPKQSARLEFFTGLSKAPNPSDGVVFRLELVEESKVKRLFEYAHSDYAWHSHQVDLTPWAGKRVALRFITDCGPANNTTADHAYWADVVLRGPHPAFERTANTPESIMTWANERPFESSFYFRDAGPASVDLAIEVEGAEPIFLANFAIHSAPDAMARAFEGGVVLANPSNHAYTFDLDRLFPGSTLRRIQGVPGQDPVTNDGAAVSGSVTVGALDGRFLVVSDLAPQ